MYKKYQTYIIYTLQKEYYNINKILKVLLKFTKISLKIPFLSHLKFNYHITVLIIYPIFFIKIVCKIISLKILCVRVCVSRELFYCKCCIMQFFLFEKNEKNAIY